MRTLRRPWHAPVRRAALALAALLLGACTRHFDALQEPGVSAAVTTTGPWASMIYAARTDSGVVVLDLGWDGDGDALDEALGRIGAGRRDVAAVFLTHSHRDHIAAWPHLRHARFHLAAAEAARFEGRAAHTGPVPRLVEKLLRTRRPSPGELRLVPFAGDTAFALGADTVRAFLVPGHTAGSAAYLFRGVLFAGDAVSFQPVLGFGSALRLYSDDVGRARASLADLRRRLEPFDVRWVCTAHGKCGRPEEALPTAGAR